MQTRVGRSIEERNKLALEYLPLVRFHADRLSQRYPVPADELESHGMIGLLKAAETFDASRSRADTWFGLKIHRAILDGLREHDFLPRRSRIKYTARQVSIDADYDGKNAAEILVADGFNPTLSIEDDDTLEFLMQGLTPRDRLILTLYIRRGKTMDQVGKYFRPQKSKRKSMSGSRVHMIWVTSILPHLRKRAAMLAA